MVYLLRELDGKKQILLQKRGKGTFGSEMWEASAAGHVEQGESLTMCAQREALEEIGIKFNPEDIEFLTIIHVLPVEPPPLDNPYYNGHFFVTRWDGEPYVCECDKCMCLEWFDLDEMPKEMFADRSTAIHNYKNKIAYSEKGWRR